MRIEVAPEGSMESSPIPGSRTVKIPALSYTVLNLSFLSFSFLVCKIIITYLDGF